MERPQFDDRDEAIRLENLAAWNEREGPRVGDFVEMLDGSLRRFTYDWGDDIQTTCAGERATDASFFFGYGYCSFSGSLDPAIQKTKLEQLSETRDGSVWFFHHNQSGAHRGVKCKVPCRVFRQIA